MILILSRRFRNILIGVIVLFLAFVALQNVKWIARTIYPIHYRDLIEKYAAEYEVDPLLVAAIIRNESKFNPRAVSRREARGLMQIAPITGTWASERLEIENYSEEMLFEPALNIRIGCWYLNILHREFDNNLPVIVAAYNAGNGNVSKWLENPEYSRDGKNLDEIPFGETRIYSRKVLRDYKIYQKIYR